MIVFHTDLDNTLIYSHRRDIGSDKQAVERYEGREISFMTTRTQELLRGVQEKVRFIPCTTRSMAQYQRLQLLPHWQPQFALVANGGILLEHGNVDEAWYQESLQLAEKAAEQLRLAAMLLEKAESRILPVKWIDSLFLFTKSDEPRQLQRQLRAQLDLMQVEVLLHGQKLYVLPRELHKGTAVQRLRCRYPKDHVIAAGDSAFDVPMLLAADYAFAPESLAEPLQAQQQKQLIPDKQLVSETVLQALCQ